MPNQAVVDSMIKDKTKQISGLFNKKYMGLVYEMLNVTPIVRGRASRFLSKNHIDTVSKFIVINFKNWKLDPQRNIGIKTIEALAKAQSGLIDKIMEDVERSFEVPLMPISITLDPFLTVKLRQLMNNNIAKLRKKKLSIKIAKEINQINQIVDAIDIAWENASTDEECYK